MRLTSFACTHIGRRSSNQDAFVCDDGLGLFVVADGMGGYTGGEVASRLTVTTVHTFVADNAVDADITWPHDAADGLTPEEGLVDVAVRLAHERVRERRTGQLAEMGSTVVVLLLRDERAVIAHVGDSRSYRLRDGALEQLTRDHSLYEQLREELGDALPPADQVGYGHVITKALGTGGWDHPDVLCDAPRPGDVYLLCSDGLSGAVSEERLAEVLRGDDPERACRTLVDDALERGARDNVTAVVVAVETAFSAAPAA